MKMRGHQEECAIEMGVVPVLPEADFRGGRFGTLDISTGFIDIHEVQSGPQREMGGEDVPPATAYVGQRDKVLIRVAFAFFFIFIIVAVIRDVRENFRGDPVYERKQVFYGPNQTEHFYDILFKSVHLRSTRLSSCMCINSFYGGLFHLSLVHSHGDPVGITNV